MARINTNVAALTAQRGLAKTQRQLNDTLQRLSTGLRINRGADDPACLIAYRQGPPQEPAVGAVAGSPEAVLDLVGFARVHAAEPSVVRPLTVVGVQPLRPAVA